MKKPFFARYALLFLMAVFFMAPFALRGARMAVQRMKNDVKDWLPSDFSETVELNWFRDRFLGEQFVVVSWEDCTGREDDESFMTFVDKFFPEVPPSEQLRRLEVVSDEGADTEPADPAGNWPIDVQRRRYIDPRLGMYVRQLHVGDLPPADEQLGNKLGLHYEPNDFDNWGGDQEKWIQGRDERWFYITPEGNVYRWKGGSSVIQPVITRLKRLMRGPHVDGDLIATLGPLDGPWYYEQRQRLSARLFKTVTTGPGVLHELTRPGGVLDNRPGKARDRLRGSLFGSDGEQTCLVLTLTEAAKQDLRVALGRGILGKPRGRLMEIAEQAGINLPPNPPLLPPALTGWFLTPAEPKLPEIRMGGPSVDNVAIDEEGQITLVRLVGFSIVVGLGLAWISFRSVNITIMVFVVGGLSAVTSLSFVYWGGTSVDAVLMSMPSLVYVLGLSGAVHIVNYYRDSVHEVGLRRAAGHALALGWKPCTLAAITTALGLLSLFASNILPIRKFGLFSAIGVLATLVLLFTYLPAALQMWPPTRFRNREKGERDRSRLEHWVEGFWHFVGKVVIRNYVVALILCFVTMIGFAAGLRRISTDVQLLKMFDADAKIIRDYRWLEENMGKLVPMEIVVRVDPQALRDTTSSAAAQDRSLEQSGEELLSLTFLERMEIVKYIEEVLDHRFGEQGEQIVGRPVSAVTFAPDLPTHGAGFMKIAQRGGTSRSMESRRDEFLRSDYLRIDPVDQSELWRISLRLGALNDIDYGRFVGDLKQTVEPVLAAYHCRRQILEAVQAERGPDDVRKTSLYLLGVPFGRSPTARQPLATSPGEGVTEGQDGTEEQLAGLSQIDVFAKILGRLLSNAGLDIRDWHDPRFELPNDWNDVLKRHDCIVVVDPNGSYDFGQLQEQSALVVDVSKHQFDTSGPTAAERGELVSAIYTGLVPVVYKAQRTLLESLIVSTGWAFGMIAVVMILVVRSIRAGLLSMVPNVFPVLLVFGAMGWLSVAVDIGSMMTASVAMGVAVDDTIHFLTWFRRGLDGGLSRNKSILLAYERVGMAMTQTTAIGGIGLSIFALSTFTPTQRFGTLMLALLAAALVGDLIFLPALLASPLGRVFDGSRRKKDSDATRGSGAADIKSSPPSRPYPVSTQLSQNRSIRR